jgi:C-terminal processing protease CtpA/Prc
MPNTKPARTTATKSIARRRRKEAQSHGAMVSGAVPYKPKMSKAEIRSSVTENLGTRVRLADYREKFSPLTLDERNILLEQAQLMLDQVYVHLPLKRAIHAIEPIRKLRLLKLRHSNLDELAFQSELIAAFQSLRDLHTNYYLPSAYQNKFAFLPFRVEEFYEVPDPKHRKFLVTWVSPVNTERRLKAGMVVTHWNGSPIDLAVARNAAREAGSNPEAQRAQGIDTLTLRWLGASLPPDEDWVTLRYTDGTKAYESQFDWELVDRNDLPGILTGLGNASPGLWGLDLKTELLRRVRKVLFDAQAVRAQIEMAEYRPASAAAPADSGDAKPPPGKSLYPDIFKRFGTVTTPSGQFGYVRIATFVPPDVVDSVDAAVQEFVRILRLLPTTGLILDVRGNGGGTINFGERILQLLTPRSISPEPFHLITGSFTLEFAELNEWLGQWKDPIKQGIETGATYSQGFPLTLPDSCNDIGQVYQGPVVLITDALCYSTTDIFAAGFQDHAIGTILGTQANTGAGGANVWDYRDDLQAVILKPHNPFVPLPQGAGMRVAARRSTRVGERSGVPLEDLGVMPDLLHYMTRADVLTYNVDLIAHAAQILEGKPKQTLRIIPVGGLPLQRVKIESHHLDRIDLVVNNRVALSLDVSSEALDISLPTAVVAGSVLKAYGYRGGDLVVSTRSQV